jgi:hypothetical protein
VTKCSGSLSAFSSPLLSIILYFDARLKYILCLNFIFKLINILWHFSSFLY